MKMTPEKYNAQLAIYDQVLNNADQKLKKVISGNRNEFGLVNDETKNSFEYKAAKSEYDKAFFLYRAFASSVPNKIKREAAMIRRKEK